MRIECRYRGINRNDRSEHRPVPVEAWYQAKEVVGAVTSAAVAFLLVVSHDWLRARRRRHADFRRTPCGNGLLLQSCPNVPPPSNRSAALQVAQLRVSKFTASFGFRGVLSEPEARNLLSSFNEVETLNRGLEQAERARLISDSKDEGPSSPIPKKWGRKKEVQIAVIAIIRRTSDLILVFESEMS